MSEIARMPAARLRSLDPGLSKEVLAWVEELRTIWAATGLSVNEFAILYPIDKGAVSRYLNGQRVPRDSWFLDNILAFLARGGRPIAPDVREHLVELHQRALLTAHPREYQVRLVRDELKSELANKLEADRYARALEKQLTDRNREMQEIAEDRNRLRAVMDSQYARLIREIEELMADLDLARSRSVRGERRCVELEALLDRMDQAIPGESGDTAVPTAVSYQDWGHIALRVLSPDDPYVVADFLSLLYRLGLRDRAEELADRVIAHISDKRHTHDDIIRHDGLLPLLATMNRLRLYDQAERFSALLGYNVKRPRDPKSRQ